MVLQARGQHECAQNFGTVLLQRHQRSSGHCKDGGQNEDSFALAVGQDVRRKKNSASSEGHMLDGLSVVLAMCWLLFVSGVACVK